jgi:hypothetical protein
MFKRTWNAKTFLFLLNTCGVLLLLFVHLVCQTFGLSDIWSVLHLVCQTFGLSDIWSVRHLVCQTFGLSDIWSVRHLVRCLACRTFWPVKHFVYVSDIVPVRILASRTFGLSHKMPLTFGWENKLQLSKTFSRKIDPSISETRTKLSFNYI